jgi:hypothetical protein
MPQFQVRKGTKDMRLLNKVNLGKMFMVLIVLSIWFVFPATSMAAKVQGIDLIDYGVYETVSKRWELAPNTAVGKIQIVKDKKLLQETDYIPGSAGTEFGIRYIVDGKQEGEDISILVRVLHSTLIERRIVSHANEWVRAGKIGSPTFDGWKFNSDSELIPGNWTIQIFHEGRKLAEKTFVVYKP